VEIPLGWFPAASLRSRDGYPVRFVDSDGITRGLLNRIDPDAAEQFVAGTEGWVDSDHPGRHRAARELFKASGERLFVAREGHGFLFEPGDTSPEDARELWDRLVESAQLLRVPRTRNNRS
jgi:hypothetical protein